MTRLAAEGLLVRRGDAALLDDVSLSASGGEFIALVGANGAGKTTLLRTLAGLEQPASGRVMIDGAGALALSPQARARKISYLPQTRDVAWSITAEAVVSLGRFAYGNSQRLAAENRIAVDRALAATDAAAFRTRTMPTLSGGEQARIHLARALSAETPILLADEPTAALDPRHAAAIMRAMRAKAEDGGLVIAASHDLRLARRFGTRMIVLDRGRIVADDAADLALTAAIAEAAFGVADY